MTEAVRRLPATQRRKVVIEAALLVLEGRGFQRPTVHVSTDGRRVSVVLSRLQACKAHADEDNRILTALKRAIPLVRVVRVAVRGWSGDLSSYIRANCHQPALPEGTGQVVVSEKGTHFADTKSFAIRAKRWTVEWANYGSFFQVYVYKGDSPVMPVISARNRGSGKQTYSGPGTFRLKVAGAEDWEIRVRDG